MKKTLVSLLASVAMLGSGLALAEEQPGKEKAGMQQQEGYGGAGQERMEQHPGQMGQMQQMGQKELTGTVVKSSTRELLVRTEDGIITLKVTGATRFQGPNVQRAPDLKEGQQVRASFEIQKDENVARSISLAPGMGGAGMEEMMEQEKEEPRGGSGLHEEGMEEEPSESE